jgi:hypothetical protein
MRKRLNMIVLIAEVGCIIILHSLKINHSDKNNPSFSQKFASMSKLQALKSPYVISSLK